jgi:predicted CXXCH cytochrome family protein
MSSLKTIAVRAISLLCLIALVAFGLKWRGFRATSTPSRFEVAVARSVRDFAVPLTERRKANPESGDWAAVEQGREDFLAQCATCHGVDGRGRTTVGANVYPRVPDLRSRATQKLTDGELHYFIQNGIQLSGMPALNDPHGESAREAWKLVSYIRTLEPLVVRRNVEGGKGSISDLRGAQYTGSNSCRKCHAEIYERWNKTPMANVIRDPRQHPDAIIPDLKTNTIAKFTGDQVAFVYGSKWKQRYFTKAGEDYYPLGVQWDISNRKWLPYHVPDTGADWWTAFYPHDNMARPTGPTCDGCHSVNYDIHTKQVSEWNVGCEKCHGPGGEHITHPTRGNILNPSGMDDVAANDTCIQCHSQGRPRTTLIEGRAYDWPVGYRVGLRLADYWVLEDHTLGTTSFTHYPDGTAHKNRMQGNDFVQSVMYRHGVTCITCHDMHGTENYAQLRKPAEKICLDCHSPSSPNGPHVSTLEAHTHHKEGSPGSQCVACHMPHIESEGVPGSFVSAHTFRFITPAMTEKYQIPNPCTSCHKGRTTAWASSAMERWTEQSPWTLQ